MRYVTPVFFQLIKSGALNTVTHNYEDDVITEVKRYADITDSGADTIKLVYGDLKQGSLTIRLQMPYLKPFDKIRINDKTYKVDFSRNKKVFVVSEAQ